MHSGQNLRCAMPYFHKFINSKIMDKQITIKDGKLLENGNPVRPRFGDPDHVSALKAALENFKTEIITVRVGSVETTAYKARVEFPCPCCKTKIRETMLDENGWEPDASDVVGLELVCDGCGITFKAEHSK